MSYYYRPTGGGYGNYQKKKGISGGTVAAILAMIIVFAAGFLIGNANNMDLFGVGTSTSSTPSEPDSGNSGAGASSDENTSSESGTVKLPSNLQTVPRPEGNEAWTIGTMNRVTAESYIVIDRLTGAIIAEKNSGTRVFPGATTQIMTAALALEKGQLTDTVKVTKYGLGLVGRDSQRFGLQNGQQLTLRSALSAMLLTSAADAANAVAETFGYNDFTAEMVTRAKELGCAGSYFVSPNGTHSTVHFSTVSDLARMEAYACQNPIYRDLASAEEFVMPADNLHVEAGWAVATDRDQLAGLRMLFENNDRIARIENTQTGYTTQGYTLVCSFVTTGGAQLTAVLGGIPYNNGAGAAECLPQMAALMHETAYMADSTAAEILVTAGEALDETQSAGVSKALPAGAKLVTPDGFRFVKGSNVLNNGNVSLFGNTAGCTVSVVYYEDLEQKLTDYRRGESVQVGYLTVTNSTGTVISNAIPVLLQ